MTRRVQHLSLWLLCRWALFLALLGLLLALWMRIVDERWWLFD